MEVRSRLCIAVLESTFLKSQWNYDPTLKILVALDIPLFALFLWSCFRPFCLKFYDKVYFQKLFFMTEKKVAVITFDLVVGWSRLYGSCTGDTCAASEFVSNRLHRYPQLSCSFNLGQKVNKVRTIPNVTFTLTVFLRNSLSNSIYDFLIEKRNQNAGIWALLTESPARCGLIP